MPSEENPPTQFFRLTRPSLWEPVGEVFVAGLLNDRDAPERRIKRAGPFVPPISFPSWSFSVVVTDSFRRQLETAGLGAFQYRPIIKEHIPEIAWGEWDRNTWSPPVSPRGDAMAYLCSLPHSPAAAGRMEDLWELILRDGPVAESYYLVGDWGEPQLLVDPATWKGDHISWGDGNHLVVVTDRMKSFLDDVAGEWVRITPARFERPPRPKFYLVNAKQALIENPNREDLEGHVQMLDESAKWTRVSSVSLIDSADWCLTAVVSGNVSVRNVAVRYQGTRILYKISRARQLELLQKFYDGDYEALMKEKWEIWENPIVVGPLGPGIIGEKPEEERYPAKRQRC